MGGGSEQVEAAETATLAPSSADENAPNKSEPETRSVREASAEEESLLQLGLT